MQQRARVSMAVLFRDLVMAGAGLQTPAIAPFRRGDENPDPPGSVFSDRISVRYMPPDAAAVGAVTITYALRDDAAGVPQLMRYDGRSTDLPVVDQLAGLRFEYFDASGRQMRDGALCGRPLGSRCGDGGSLRRRSPGDSPGACAGTSASGTHAHGGSARRPRPPHRCVAEEPESPMTLVIALISLVLLSVLGTSLTMVDDVPNCARPPTMRQAARRCMRRKVRFRSPRASCWRSATGTRCCRGGVLSGFVDGAPGGVRQLGDGSIVDLVQATSLANGEPRPWGANNPVWRLFAFGWLGPKTYVIAWVGDDFAENDGDPLTDGGGKANPGSGILAVRAEAFGVGGAHTVLEAMRSARRGGAGGAQRSGCCHGRKSGSEDRTRSRPISNTDAQRKSPHCRPAARPRRR